ncbi:MAG: four helix bundle protein [Bacteroidota bacterium]
MKLFKSSSERVKEFEEAEIGQFARVVCTDIQDIMERTLLHENQLGDRMNSWSRSIRDNIAKVFKRNDNRESIQFFSKAITSCGELRSQRYHRLDRKHIHEPLFEALLGKTNKEGKQIGAFIGYLKKSERRGVKIRLNF